MQNIQIFMFYLLHDRKKSLTKKPNNMNSIRFVKYKMFIRIK